MESIAQLQDTLTTRGDRAGRLVCEKLDEVELNKVADSGNTAVLERSTAACVSTVGE